MVLSRLREEERIWRPVLVGFDVEDELLVLWYTVRVLDPLAKLCGVNLELAAIL